MIYYKSSLSKNYKINSKSRYFGSLLSKLIYGSWLVYTFIVFEFGKDEKISFDYSEQGIRISTDERILEKR
jgi:hypothetical protein